VVDVIGGGDDGRQAGARRRFVFAVQNGEQYPGIRGHD